MTMVPFVPPPPVPRKADYKIKKHTHCTERRVVKSSLLSMIMG